MANTKSNYFFTGFSLGASAVLLVVGAIFLGSFQSENDASLASELSGIEVTSFNVVSGREAKMLVSDQEGLFWIERMSDSELLLLISSNVRSHRATANAEITTKKLHDEYWFAVWEARNRGLF